MPFTTSEDQTQLNRIFQDGSTVYIGLSKTAIAKDGTGITEPSGGAYARVAVVFNSTNFPNATADGSGNGQISNGVAIDFTTPTADWTATGETVGYWFASTALTGGTIRMYGTLTNAKPITNGDPVSFPIGSLVAKMN